MPRNTLFCFHHAGGTEHQFRRWRRHLSPRVEVVGVPLERRDGSAQTIEDLARTALPHLSRADMARTALYGHSMGGLVAYQVCSLLDDAKTRLPAAVVLGAAPAPGTISPPDATIAQLAGTSPTTSRIPRHIQDRICNGLVRSHLYSPATSNLDVVLDLVNSTDDPIVGPCQIDTWKNFCGPPPRLHDIQGGHLFHQTATSALLEIIAKILDTQLLKNS